jgi:hypothetical protein
MPPGFMERGILRRRLDYEQHLIGACSGGGARLPSHGRQLAEENIRSSFKRVGISTTEIGEYCFQDEGPPVQLPSARLVALCTLE